ncbi:LamG domain-containing protein, partial [Candidatus Parcubacteria bacterium]|nr:LamG domain-containing protein [Candidatus Parcubacteria bacterium]
MKRLLLALGFFFLGSLPAYADVTLTTNTTFGFLRVETGSTFTTNGFNVTVTSSTGGTIVYGYLNALKTAGSATLFTQRNGQFITAVKGGVRFSGTGKLLLSGTGTTYPFSASGYLQNLTIDTGLSAYWKLDEAVGTKAKDSSRFNNSCTLTNGAVWTGSTIPALPTFQFYNPSSIHLDGTNDFLNCGTAINGNGPISIALWFKQPTLALSKWIISLISKSNSVDVPFEVQARSGVLRYSVGNGATSANWDTSASVYSANTWTHMV